MTRNSTKSLTTTYRFSPTEEGSNEEGIGGVLDGPYKVRGRHTVTGIPSPHLALLDPLTMCGHWRI
jgi:hypothetical protein